MTRKTRTIQLALLCLGLILILSLYVIFPKIETNKLTKQESIERKILETEEETKSNTFIDVEYKGFYHIENPFVVKAEKAYIDKSDSSTVNMVSMNVEISLKNGEIWRIMCDRGRYLKSDYDIYCEGNVLATNGKTKVRSEYLNLLATQDTASVYENVIITDKEGSILKADFVDYDLEKKKYKVSMLKDRKVKIKLIE